MQSEGMSPRQQDRGAVVAGGLPNELERLAQRRSRLERIFANRRVHFEHALKKFGLDALGARLPRQRGKHRPPDRMQIAGTRIDQLQLDLDSEPDLFIAIELQSPFV